VQRSKFVSFIAKLQKIRTGNADLLEAVKVPFTPQSSFNSERVKEGT